MISILNMNNQNLANGQVPLREAIESDAFKVARAQSNLVIPLANETNGNLELFDFSQTPHLLVAGCVSKGKLEFFYSLIASLALCHKSSEVQLLLIDVTRVELLSLKGLTHLAMPIIQCTEKAIEILHWLDNEMKLRQQELASVEAPNIEAYNKGRKVGKLMRYLVVVIYDIADLIVWMPEVVESIICRLTRSAHEVGIHLVISTQRLGSEILTPSLMAAFPTRACFVTANSEGSQFILGISGAEKLRERGDMIYVTPEADKPRLLIGFSISYDEINNLVSFGRLGS